MSSCSFFFNLPETFFSIHSAIKKNNENNFNNYKHSSYAYSGPCGVIKTPAKYQSNNSNNDDVNKLNIYTLEKKVGIIDKKKKDV